MRAPLIRRTALFRCAGSTSPTRSGSPARMSTARSTGWRRRGSPRSRTSASGSVISRGCWRWPAALDADLPIRLDRIPTGNAPGDSIEDLQDLGRCAISDQSTPRRRRHGRIRAMSNRSVIPLSAHRGVGKISEADYFRLYERSLADPDGFWGEQGKRVDWIKPYTKVCTASFEGDVSIRWYEDGTLNASYNCIDRHLAKRGDQTAILWEGDDPSEDKRVSYRELHEQVCRLANALKAQGVNKGDRVTIYMPMIPEAAVAMLACARLGAIHSVVFGGFSPDSLAGRIEDCRSTVLITADEGLRGGRKVPLKRNADTALRQCLDVNTVIVVKRTGGEIEWVEGRDHWYHEVCAAAFPDCPPTEMSAEDPLFILYTSGSTGKPKGVLHTTGGYLVYTSMTHEYVFDYRDGEVYWCTADVGWVTGHSYIVYGPLANGATTLMFEGVPNYPDPSRFWQVCDKHNVSIFYTAPTAIRALMREGEDYVR